MLRFALAALGLRGATAGPLEYRQEKALEYSYLATAAYCGYPKTSQASLEAWNCGPACDAVKGVTDVRQILTSDDNDAYAYVARFRGRCLVAFRGTSDLAGWMQDLQSLRLVELSSFGVNCSFRGNLCLVGDGFASNYYSISEYIQTNLTAIGCLPGDTVSLTGHSLGAAEATIAAYDLHSRGYATEQIYSFGQPRVGDRVFAEALDKLINLTNIFRVTYHEDPVVHLPFREKYGFEHIGGEIFYDGDVSQGYVTCLQPGEDTSCANKFTDFTAMLLRCLGDIRDCDHLKYMTSLKQISMDGSSCTDSSPETLTV